MIRAAIGASPELSRRGRIEVFAQGSYRNNTNVRLDSDVDICVLCFETFHYDRDPGVNLEGLFGPATYEYSTYKQEVSQALYSKFGYTGVTKGNKSFDIHENTYRVDADVVACFEWRWFFNNGYGRVEYHSGTCFFTEQGRLINNYPKQSYENGVQKNNATGRRFKGVVRILKRLRNAMAEAGGPEVPSFLIESLAWNAPNSSFGHATYFEDLASVLQFLTVGLQPAWPQWCEVNGIKYLFHGDQPWTLDQARQFVHDSANWISTRAP